MANAVYSGYLAMYIATGAVPAIVLGRTVLKKIARLEAKQGGRESARKSFACMIHAELSLTCVFPLSSPQRS